MNKKSCSIGQLVFGFYFFNRYSFVHSPTLRSGQAWQKAFEFHSEFFRAFSVFCGKILFGIQACIPRHCGRGRRGKSIFPITRIIKVRIYNETPPFKIVIKPTFFIRQKTKTWKANITFEK